MGAWGDGPLENDDVLNQLSGYTDEKYLVKAMKEALADDDYNVHYGYAICGLLHDTYKGDKITLTNERAEEILANSEFRTLDDLIDSDELYESEATWLLACSIDVNDRKILLDKALKRLLIELETEARYLLVDESEVDIFLNSVGEYLTHTSFDETDMDLDNSTTENDFELIGELEYIDSELLKNMAITIKKVKVQHRNEAEPIIYLNSENLTTIVKERNKLEAEIMNLLKDKTYPYGYKIIPLLLDTFEGKKINISNERADEILEITKKKSIEEIIDSNKLSQDENKWLIACTFNKDKKLDIIYELISRLRYDQEKMYSVSDEKFKEEMTDFKLIKIMKRLNSLSDDKFKHPIKVFEPKH